MTVSSAPVPVHLVFIEVDAETRLGRHFVMPVHYFALPFFENDIL